MQDIFVQNTHTKYLERKNMYGQRTDCGNVKIELEFFDNSKYSDN